jgi:TPR repeat protein
LAAAQAKVGFCHWFGQLTEKDSAKAVECFSLAASQGHPEGQLGLSMAYENGLGLQIDPDLAAKYCLLAADQGHVQAQTNMGFFYKKGFGVKLDFGLAVHY